MKISKLIRARQQAFEAYDEARTAAFHAANYRDTAKSALADADREIQNFLRSSLPS